jgi:hypothetical protein
MKATLNKHLHERALGIIEMIETADQRIKVQEDNIKNLKGHFFFTKDICEAKIARLNSVKERLNKSYNTTIERINKAKQ